ncbi:hypothetical protein [Kineosporia succinea]|uniref:Uncharacterized protein n=1 Tax=Kineosporia succinea TaxID=84632 RepID=A0ABT9P0X4_9ACTN|nr:hypothetical protein [Kineosporia succinea]MDP9826331.1 hypothetical protein [Kineosporia succinea]
MSEIVWTGVFISGAVAAGQFAWLGMDKLIGMIGTEPRTWLENKLRSES